MWSLKEAYQVFFDESWYLHRYPGAGVWVEQGVFASARECFGRSGHAEGHSPGPLFSTPHYAAQSAGYRSSPQLDAVAHYVQQGAREHTSPHWLFAEDFYLAHCGRDATPAESTTIACGYHHFLSAPTSAPRRPHPLFCAEWLRRGTADEGDVGAYRRYLTSLQHEGKSPSPLFDADWYLSRCEDVIGSIGPNQEFASAVEHFLRRGLPEGRSPLPDFDATYYAQRRPDVAEAVAKHSVPSFVHHWLFHGVERSCDPNRFFNSEYYLRHNRGVAEEIARLGLLGPFEHFLMLGRDRGLRCSEGIAFVEVAEEAGKAIFARKAEVACQQFLALAPLVFPEPAATPRVSVVIPVHDSFAFTAQLLLDLHRVADESLELIVVDDGSGDQTQNLGQLVEHVKVLKTSAQVGFPAACNLGWQNARGQFVVFLNNDVELGHGALATGASTLAANPDVGAVGGRIIRTHGRLQEAGSIVWSDGSALGYGRDADPTLPQFQAFRDVDYVSACFLMVRRDLLERLGGFDEDYSPGYYEDADLCFRIWQSGLRVVYDPRVYLYHYEHASYSAGRPPAAAYAIMRAHRDLLRAKHGPALRAHPPPSPACASYAVDRRQRARAHVLLVEDMTPNRTRGAGFVRSSDVVEELIGLGCHVTVFSMAPQSEAEAAEVTWPSHQLEVIHRDGNGAGLQTLVDERLDMLDAIWVCRTHNAHLNCRLLAGLAARTKRPRLIFDTEAIATNREQTRALLRGDPRWTESVYWRTLRDELSVGQHFDVVLTVNERERSQARRFLPDKEHYVLGHRLEPTADPPGFEERNGFLFVGGVHHEDSPNYDGLVWFLSRVWPGIREELPSARFTVVGNWESDVRCPREMDAPGVEFIGPVENLEPHFSAHRVFVAPTRYAAGLPFKVHHAVASGIPPVITPLLAEQLGWQDSGCSLSSTTLDPEEFARACVRAHTERPLWESMLRQGPAAIRQCCSSREFADVVVQSLALSPERFGERRHAAEPAVAAARPDTDAIGDAKP